MAQFGLVLLHQLHQEAPRHHQQGKDVIFYYQMDVQLIQLTMDGLPKKMNGK